MKQRRSLIRKPRRRWAAALCALLACAQERAAPESEERDANGGSLDAGSHEAAAAAPSDASSLDASLADAAGCRDASAASGCGIEGGAQTDAAPPSSLDDGATVRPTEAGATPRQDAGEDSCDSLSFDHHCETLVDCEIVRRPVDCCGTLRVLAIHESTLAAFHATVSRCSATQPICDCLPGATRADDGSSAPAISSVQPSVACVAGQCWTSYGALRTKTPRGD